MAVKRGLNMAKGLEALIPQDKNKNKPVQETSANTIDTKAGESKSAETNAGKQASAEVAEPAVKTKTRKKAADSLKEKADSNAAKATEVSGQPIELRITQIVPNQSQPREEFDEDALTDLSESIRQHGILQPLLVQKSGKYYEIIAGERRWRAAKLAGLKKIPVIIREFSKQEIVEISLIENIQREDLNPIEEAKAYKRLLDEFDLKQEEVAVRVSKSRSAVANALRLLNLDDSIQKMLISDELSAGHARALLSLENKDIQRAAAQEIVTRHLNVRETEKLVKRLMKPVAQKREKIVDTQIESAYHAIEEQLTERMGTKVTIQRGRGKRGKIEIEYYSQDDLDRIIDLMR